MKIAKLDTYINKKVEVTTIFDYEPFNEVLTGILKKTGAEEFNHNPSLYYKKGFYIVVFEDGTHSYLFRAYHVKKIKEVK